MPQNVLITGGAGFIGSHLTDKLLSQNNEIVILDSFNNFYEPEAKRQNIQNYLKSPNYSLIEGDLRDDQTLNKCFAKGPFDVVVHLAAMAGVRPSLEQPSLYMDINVVGTQKLIDHILMEKHPPRLVFGSSSSVYGTRSGESFKETDRIDQPLSPYAASKAAGELICYSAHHTKKLQTVCLRFFTVFGPRQRPDLAIHKFCKLIDQGKTIEVYGDGTSKRDYTFVKDIVSGIESAMTFDFSGFEIINLGRGEPVILMDMIKCLEKELGKKANLIHKEKQIGDMPYTYANIEKAENMLSYKPQTPFSEGIKEFVVWYKKNPVLLG
jgi:UDP-glucuronate 4-epimerase